MCICVHLIETLNNYVVHSPAAATSLSEEEEDIFTFALPLLNFPNQFPLASPLLFRGKPHRTQHFDTWKYTDTHTRYLPVQKMITQFTYLQPKRLHSSLLKWGMAGANIGVSCSRALSLSWPAQTAAAQSVSSSRQFQRRLAVVFPVRYGDRSKWFEMKLLEFVRLFWMF